ncbi:MAG: sulfatase-like hydrolase/transferase [Rikenellaceae bacterium]
MKPKAITTLILPVTLLSQAAIAQDRPNILFIYADDQCFESLYCDSDGIQTPNLDKLMQRGTIFTQAHNQGGWSPGVSVASRTMMATGGYLWNAARTSATSQQKAGVANTPREMPDYTVEVAATPRIWPQLMSDAGYETYMAGKWHVNVSADEVFDHTGTVRGGMPSQHKDCYNRLFDGVTEDKWTPYDQSYGGFWAGGKHWSEVLKDEALEFIEHTKSVEKPFFIYLGFNAAHDPRQSPKEFVDMYPAEDISVPESFVGEYPYAYEIGAGEYLRDEKLAPFPRNERSVQVNRQEYYAIITHMDQQIGEILAELEASGKADNTYIIFTADHGIAIGDHGFMGKQNMYEKSLRVPLIICGPNVPANKQIDEYVYLQDVMPTAIEIAGATPPSYVDYHSLLPMATGESRKSEYKYLYGAYMGVQRMVKGKDYKMIIYPNVNIVRLYNLKKDPLELNDLAQNAKYKSKMIELFEEFKKLQVEVGDPLDVTPYFNAFISKL